MKRRNGIGGLAGVLAMTSALPLSAQTSTAESTVNPVQSLGATERVSQKAAYWMTEARELLQARGMEFLVNLTAAIAIFYVGRWLARIAARLSSAMMLRVHVDEMLVRFLSNVIYTLLLVVVSMASLEMLGVNVTSLTAILAAAGFAIGMALQGSLSNFAAGIMLIVLKPFRVGDFITAGSAVGSVQEINIFNTILTTPENVRLIVPNGQITSSAISNFSAEPRRKMSLKVTCGYGDDLRAVKAFLEEEVQNDPRILSEPAPAVAVDNLADFAVELSVSVWTLTRDNSAVKAALLERIKLGFDDRGFTVPFPSRDVYMHAAA